MNKSTLLSVKEYIDQRRTISLENLYNYFNIEKNELKRAVVDLEGNKFVRFVTRGCSFDCSSCATSSPSCSDKVESRITDNTIIISLHI